jgi:flagellar protein FlaG
MEIFQTTAKMQQSQTSMPKPATTELQSTQSVQQMQKVQINQDKVAQINSDEKTSKVDSQEQMDKLIDQLNRSLDPFNTSLRFGFDNSSDDFYVSVIETKSNRMLRRFPLEQAQQLLPKMQEVNGLLFDQKG